REHAGAPQHDRVHAVLLLSVGSARAAAGLVQVGALSLAGRQGSARRPRRLRCRAAERNRNTRLGFDRRDALPGRTDAPGRHRGLERGAPRRARHARFDDRHRPCPLAGGDRAMNGVHDMGGMDGFGKVESEPNEPPFHEKWEGRVLAMQRSLGYAGAWHIDHGRFAQEALPPRTYLAASYYWRWALGMQKNLLERGLVTQDEIAAGHSLRPGR